MNIEIHDVYNDETIILGYLMKNESSIPFNTILLTAKAYIFWSFTNKKDLHICQFQRRLYNNYLEQSSISKLKDKEINFKNKWNFWSDLFIDFEKTDV